MLHTIRKIGIVWSLLLFLPLSAFAQSGEEFILDRFGVTTGTYGYTWMDVTMINGGNSSRIYMFEPGSYYGSYYPANPDYRYVDLVNGAKYRADLAYNGVSSATKIRELRTFTVNSVDESQRGAGLITLRVAANNGVADHILCRQGSSCASTFKLYLPNYNSINVQAGTQYTAAGLEIGGHFVIDDLVSGVPAPVQTIKAVTGYVWAKVPGSPYRIEFRRSGPFTADNPAIRVETRANTPDGHPVTELENCPGAQIEPTDSVAVIGYTEDANEITLYATKIICVEETLDGSPF